MMNHKQDLLTIYRTPQEKLSAKIVRVRLFGAVELENKWGRFVEMPTRKNLMLQMFKCLLIDPSHEAHQDVLLRQVGEDQALDKKLGTKLRVQLLRLREELQPMKLGGRDGLIRVAAGKYDLNPDYQMVFDTDVFLELLRQIETRPVDDPQGVTLCLMALQLYRGPLLEYSEEASWLAGLRSFYHNAFSQLVQETIKRMKASETDDALMTLWTRAAAFIPENEKLHLDIMQFMIQHGMQGELKKYRAQLYKSEKASWLDAYGGKDTVVLSSESDTFFQDNISGDGTVYARLFGPVTLTNTYGRVIEKTSMSSKPFFLIKYFLLNPDAKLSSKEVLQIVQGFGSSANEKSTAASNVHRANILLDPLCLGDGMQRVILAREGKYFLNPDIPLKRDADFLRTLMEKIEGYPAAEPLGLKLCIEALKIYRGPLLEYTKEEPWVMKARERYHDVFCHLAGETLNRMRMLEDYDGLQLLAQRAALIVPDAQDIHMEIQRILTAQKQEARLARHIDSLKASGKAPWLAKTLPMAAVPKETEQEHGQIFSNTYERSGTEGSHNSALTEQKETIADTEEPGRKESLPEEKTNIVRVKLFGDVELSNRYGKVVENRGRKPLAFRLIKYLLLEPDREANVMELVQQLWPSDASAEKGFDAEYAVCMRLSRARLALKPLRLSKPKDLLLYRSGICNLNPAYTLVRDVDVFEDLVKQVHKLPVKDPQGLKLCADALELYRGPLLEYTEEASWFLRQRKFYSQVFCALVKTTLERIKALDTEEGLQLLCKRTAILMPETQELHEEIICYLKRKNTVDLTRHISQLKSTGKAAWLDDAWEVRNIHVAG